MRRGFALGLLLVLAVAGCGKKGTGNPVASVSRPPAATASATPDNLTEQQRAVKFAQCMRANGLPDWPDPKFNGNGGVDISAPEGSDRTKVDAAMRKCKALLPNGGEPQKADPAVVAQLRKFSQCMREHGVPKFPDPTDQGLQVDNDKLGIDANGTVFKAAQQACSKYQPAPPSGDAGGGLSTNGNNG
jgi:hypothetical protein